MINIFEEFQNKFSNGQFKSCIQELSQLKFLGEERESTLTFNPPWNDVKDILIQVNQAVCAWAGGENKNDSLRTTQQALKQLTRLMMYEGKLNFTIATASLHTAFNLGIMQTLDGKTEDALQGLIRIFAEIEACLSPSDSINRSTMDVGGTVSYCEPAKAVLARLFRHTPVLPDDLCTLCQDGGLIPLRSRQAGVGAVWLLSFLLILKGKNWAATQLLKEVERISAHPHSHWEKMARSFNSAQSSLSQDPYAAFNFFLLAICSLACGESCQETSRLLNKALFLNPNLEEARLLSVQLQQTHESGSSKLFEQEVMDRAKALCAPSQLQLAACAALQQGNHREALVFLMRALGADKEDEVTFYLMAKAHRLADKSSELPLSLLQNLASKTGEGVHSENMLAVLLPRKLHNGDTTSSQALEYSGKMPVISRKQLHWEIVSHLTELGRWSEAAEQMVQYDLQSQTAQDSLALLHCEPVSALKIAQTKALLALQSGQTNQALHQADEILKIHDGDLPALLYKTHALILKDASLEEIIAPITKAVQIVNDKFGSKDINEFVLRWSLKKRKRADCNLDDQPPLCCNSSGHKLRLEKNYEEDNFGPSFVLCVIQNNFALSLVMAGRLYEAAHAFEKCSQILPAAAQPVFNLVLVLLRLAQVPSACKCWITFRGWKSDGDRLYYTSIKQDLKDKFKKYHQTNENKHINSHIMPINDKDYLSVPLVQSFSLDRYVIDKWMDYVQENK